MDKTSHRKPMARKPFLFLVKRPLLSPWIRWMHENYLHGIKAISVSTIFLPNVVTVSAFFCFFTLSLLLHSLQVRERERWGGNSGRDRSFLKSACEFSRFIVWVSFTMQHNMGDVKHNSLVEHNWKKHSCDEIKQSWGLSMRNYYIGSSCSYFDWLADS